MEESRTIVLNAIRYSIRVRAWELTCQSTVIKNHTCTRCNQTFSLAQTLKIHRLIHQRESRYDCVQCVKSFHRSEHLKTHMLVHTGERSYICRKCNKSFSHLQTVQKELLHLEICKDKGIKLRICDLCKKSFSYAGGLKSHILSRTGEKNIFLQNVFIRALC